VLVIQPTEQSALVGAGVGQGAGPTVGVTPIPSDPYAAAGETSRPVRVVAYLSSEESEQLDQLWLKMRGYGVRPSKADIMRMALLHAIDSAEAIAERVKAADAAEASAAAMTARASRRR
jgi:hypothetical protein